MRSYALPWPGSGRDAVHVHVSLPVVAGLAVVLFGSGRWVEQFAGPVDVLVPGELTAAALSGGATPWLLGVAAALGVAASAGVHALGHVVVARRYGVASGVTTLWVFGDLALADRRPARGWSWHQTVWFALGGPLATLLLAAVFAVLALALTAAVAPLAFLCGWLALANFALAAANALPTLPFDGGRVVRPLQAQRRSTVTAVRASARAGTGLALGAAVVGVLAVSPVLVLLALFTHAAAATGPRAMAADGLLAGLTARDVADHGVAMVRADDSLSAFVDRMVRDRLTAHPVVDGSGTLVGVVTLDDVAGVPRAEHGQTPVRAVMSDAALTVPASADAFDVLVALRRSRAHCALVEDGGRVVGTVSLPDFGAAVGEAL